MLLIQSIREKCQIKIYIKKEKKRKKIATTINIINQIRETNIKAALLICKDMIVVRKRFDFVTFEVKTKKTKNTKKTIFEQKKYCRT